MIKIQFLLLFVGIIIIYLIIPTYNEHFDEKINESNQVQCGIMCSKILDCNAFAHDPQKNICYLSQSQILRKPLFSLFSDKYNRSFPRCNKVGSITDPQIAQPIDYKYNATYFCKDTQDTESKIKIYDNKEKQINNLNELVQTDVDKYKIIEIDWMNTVNLSDKPELIQNPNSSNSISVMKAYDDEYLGQYVYPHKCVTDISQEDCMKDCLNNSMCVGTDWNPLLSKNNKIYHSVCCPKRKITKIVSRNNNNRYGKFYAKESQYKKNMESNQLYITYNKLNPNQKIIQSSDINYL